MSITMLPSVSLWPGRVGAWVGYASWMGEGHYSAVEINDACGPVSCDPTPRLDYDYLDNVVRVVWESGAIELVCFA